LLPPLKLALPLDKCLDSYVSPAQAAEILNVSPDTVRRHYAHLFRRLSPGRIGIKLRLLFEEIDGHPAA
jgi:hypothetical protein